MTNWYCDFFGSVVVRPYLVTSPRVPQETPALCPECLDHVARFLGLHAIIIVPLVDPDKGHLSIIGAFNPGVKLRKVSETTQYIAQFRSLSAVWRRGPARGWVYGVQVRYWADFSS